MFKAAPRLKTLSLSSHRNSFINRLMMRVSRQLAAYAFLLPALLLFALLAWYPISRAFKMSFEEVNLRGHSTWVDLDNYRKM